jgi:hypothetical protein
MDLLSRLPFSLVYTPQKPTGASRRWKAKSASGLGMDVFFWTGKDFNAHKSTAC